MLEISAGKYENDLKKIYRQLKAQELVFTQRKWQAYMQGSQLSIATGVVTVVHLDIIYFDCDGIGITSYGYIAPERGFYFSRGNVRWDDTSAGASYLSRIYNGTTGASHGENRARGEAANWLSIPCTAIVPCEAGDRIDLRGYHQDGTNDPDFLGGTISASHLVVHLLSRRCPT